MSDQVRFGMNSFQRPASAVPAPRYDTAAWLTQARARRARLLGEERVVSGQEVTPQHQRQQLLAQVERAQRPQLLALFALVATRRVPLEAAFNAGELASGAKDVATLRSPGSDEDMRAQLIRVIQTAPANELSAIYRAVNGAQRARIAPQPALQHEPSAPSR